VLLIILIVVSVN